MKAPLKIVACLCSLLLLAGCDQCPDEHIGDILSPDGAHKVELRSCGCNSAVREVTQATIMKADETSQCRSAMNLAGFDAPFDHTRLTVRWLSNDTVEASYEGQPDFPYSAYMSPNSSIKLLFPGSKTKF